jgi:hypothetical protein
MITRITNAIERYKEAQKKLLIPDWENPKYLRTVEKLGEYKERLRKALLEQHEKHISNRD